MKLTLLPLQNDELVRVRWEGPISLRGRPAGHDPLQELLGPQCFGHKVILNLEKAVGIDTSGVSWLMHTQKRFAQAGGRLILCGIPPVVSEVLELLRLTDLIDAAPTEADARDLALGRPRPGAAGTEPNGGAVPAVPRLSG
jgi:anti-anti-sigma factor